MVFGRESIILFIIHLNKKEYKLKTYLRAKKLQRINESIYGRNMITYNKLFSKVKLNITQARVNVRKTRTVVFYLKETKK